jgi:hypothetical protein
MDRWIAEKPLKSRIPKIQNKKSMPQAIAKIERAKPIRFALLRRAKMASFMS